MSDHDSSLSGTNQVPPQSPNNNDNSDDRSVVVPPTPMQLEPPRTPLSVAPPPEDHTDSTPTRQQQQQPLLDDPQLQHIRGTDVHVPTAAAAYTDFLRRFRSIQHAQTENDESSVDSLLSAPEDVTPLYVAKLNAILQQPTDQGAASLEIDTMHLYYHSQESQKLYQQLLAYPMEIVPLMDILSQRELERINDNRFDQDLLPRIQVRPYNLRNIADLRQLDPSNIDSLLCIKGMIVRSSPIIPDLKVAHFSCSICGHNLQITIDRGRIREPQNRCPTCNVKAYSLTHNRSVFADKQMVRIQETPDQVPAGHTPASVVTFCFDDLVDSVQPGDKVEVTGVLRAQPVRIHPKLSKIKTVYKTYLDVIHFRKVNGMATRAEDLTTEGGKAYWTPERIQEFQALAQRSDIYQQLTQSLAPSIWELDDIKKGILCMLFGGNHVRVKRGTALRQEQNEQADDWLDEENDAGNGQAKLHKRGDINILLCGDPGTSKSQLLSYVNKISTRGVYTSGKGSSAVGLTASVVRDPETKDLVLESGALVLSDLGICCIDEFDKMSDTTRSVLHEAMEQQTVSIAKAGIIATLHARTSVLASANPVESRYNPSLSVVENIQLPPTLLSRFDLIYLVLDSPNDEHDRRLAQHLVGLYYETPNVIQPPISQALLRDYIAYARENIHPEISLEASEQLINSYLEMRLSGGNIGGNGSRTISATPRQLESLIRLSEALAKMRYSRVVTRADAREAVRLMRVATQTAATDPRTGRIDMDLITTGRSRSDREMEEQINVSLRELLAERRGSRMGIRDVSRQLNEITNLTLSHDDIVDSLRQMEADGLVQFNERAQTIFVRTGIVR